ncbi:histidinol dehydrogenase [Marinicella sp. S1101]|uniref:histidinol dehydrogenase n=1 Tax=Marinicella marina TaxID=2996016 RepID=UPI002260E213|nr:histidinol dehydrogenase [Marinicella marina]MCX7553270.1 histidinol dehydrogenase [Marinicella marina]MDJ1139002.1 histidinol dehydrogenase [Marinicella marina]
MSDKFQSVQAYIRPSFKDQSKVETTVANILGKIKDHGDKAVQAISQKIDQQDASYIELKPFDEYELATGLKEAIQSAHMRIKKFCKFQIKSLKSDAFSDEMGDFGFVYQPIERIGAYIPGGQFPLISTALMTLTPAQVAGCPVRVACSPSDHPALLAAASLAGATQFLHLGGAQAIGALSYGFSETAPVNLIVGPGNAYVNQAKAQVQHRTLIDTLAGPSELLIYANQVKQPEWLMFDALAQAEHDANAISIVVSESSQLLTDLNQLIADHPDGQALLDNDNIVLLHADDQDQAIAFINDYAPEHLMVCDESLKQSLFTNYGSLFIGENSAVAFGDYCAGPNHTLPTAGAAKFSGGLSVHQFLKVLSTQKINGTGRGVLANISAKLAAAEGLVYHQKSAEIRKQLEG